MENLPEELLQIICQRLTLRDLCACCAVSRGWRDIFNKDLVWRAYSDPKLANYLETTDCVITPGFAIPVVEGSDLSSLCEGRQNCMRELCLWNNWKTGKGKIQQIENLSFPAARLTLYKNDFLVVGFSTSIELWDIREKPVVYVNDPCRLVTKNHSILPLVLLVYEDNLIVIQCLIVQVYKISLLAKEWSLVYSFLLNSDNMSNSITFEDYLPVVDMKFSYSQILAGDCLIGISPDNSMHIWNLKTLKKVKTETFLPGGTVRLLRWDSSTNNLAIRVVNETNAKVYCFKIYCLSDFSFKPFTRSYTVDPNAGMHYNTCVLLGPLIAIQFQDVVDVYNHMTGKLLHHLEGNVSEEYCYLSLWRDKIVLRHDWFINQFNQLTDTFETFVDNLECNISNFIPVSDHFTVCFTSKEDLFDYFLFCKDENNEIALCFTNELNFKKDGFEYDHWQHVSESLKVTKQYDGRLDKAMPISFEMPRSVEFSLLNDVCTKLIVESCGDLFVVSFW